MNVEIIKGNWNRLKGKIKEKWGKITDDDVAYINGSYDILLGTIQKKHGHQKEQAEKEVKEFLKENDLEEVK